MAVIYDINYDNTNVYSSIAGWGANGEYRQITLAEPATGELKTWLEANAVRLPLTGTWVFNNTLSAWPSLLNNTSLYTTFESNNTTYSKFDFIYGSRTGLYYNSTLAYVLSDAGELVNIWNNEAYRTITFNQPVQYQGNEEFVRWFVDNAVPLPIIEKGTYVFKDGLSSGQWTKGSSITQRIVAKSNNTDVSSIILLVGAERTADGLEGFNIEKISYDLNVGGMTKTTQVYFAYAWASAAYKTIEITEDCIVDKQFKKWFDYYTTKQ